MEAVCYCETLLLTYKSTGVTTQKTNIDIIITVVVVYDDNFFLHRLPDAKDVHNLSLLGAFTQFKLPRVINGSDRASEFSNPRLRILPIGHP
jgi:hypothetical protein